MVESACKVRLLVISAVPQRRGGHDPTSMELAAYFPGQVSPTERQSKNLDLQRETSSSMHLSAFIQTPSLLRGGCGFCRTLPESAEGREVSCVFCVGVSGFPNRWSGVRITPRLPPDLIFSGWNHGHRTPRRCRARCHGGVI